MAAASLQRVHLLWVVFMFGFQLASCRSVPESGAEGPKSLAGEYLVFGWGAGQDFVKDYPVYVGFASISQNGDSWQMIQTKGQKVNGAAKENSYAVGSTTKKLATFGWASDAKLKPGITVHGSAEYRRVSDDILIGPWTEYGSGNVGFEELVRFTVGGYYVNLHTRFQKSLRARAASSYAPGRIESGKFLVHGWLREDEKYSIPDHQGTAITQATGSTVHFSFNIPDSAALAVGIPRSEGGITIGWWNTKGDWGSANLSWSGQVLQGIWTRFGSPTVGYERLLRVSSGTVEVL